MRCPPETFCKALRMALDVVIWLRKDFLNTQLMVPEYIRRTLLTLDAGMPLNSKST